MHKRTNAVEFQRACVQQMSNLNGYLVSYGLSEVAGICFVGKNKKRAALEPPTMVLASVMDRRRTRKVGQ